MYSPWPGHSRLRTGTPPGPLRPRRTSSASPRDGTAVNRPENSFVELIPGGDTELREDPVEVKPDGAVREVELLADLPVREPLGSQLGDGEFLRREPIRRSLDAASTRLAGGPEFLAGGVRERWEGEGVEGLPRRTQGCPRFRDPPLPAQPAAVPQEHAASVARPSRQVAFDGVYVQGLGVLI